MEDGSSAASGSNSEQHPPLAGYSSWECRENKLWRRLRDFWLDFGCDFAVWALISGLRVLSNSWVFRVLICAEAAIGFGWGPILNMPWPLAA
jgi:hypothetical protein